MQSPIDGQVSRYYLTLGNLVNQDQTQLTTVVSVDPMYVYFDVDETTLIRVRKAINDGTVTRYEQGGIPVFISLEGEDNFPHQGTINFVNNRVNSGTGSITVRGVIENPKPDNGIRLLTPGMFVRVRLPIGKPHEALLVIDRAIGSDQGLKFLYVVDAENHVQQRRIETGPLARRRFASNHFWLETGRYASLSAAFNKCVRGWKSCAMCSRCRRWADQRRRRE